jgi:hypothetical protein
LGSATGAAGAVDPPIPGIAVGAADAGEGAAALAAGTPATGAGAADAPATTPPTLAVVWPPGVPTGAAAYVHVGALPLLHAASASPSASASPALPGLPFIKTILPGLECPSLVGVSVRRSGRSARSTSGPLTGAPFALI